MSDDEEEGARAARPCRARHDGFTTEKKRKFFKALKETGCLSDAARVAGVSTNTVRRHRDKWPEFDARVEAALGIAAPALEAVAYRRATVGAEEKVYREGKLVASKVKPSDSMLRLLLQGAKPGKYGRTGQMPKRAVMKKLRKEAKAEALGELTASKEEVTEALLKSLAALARRKRAEGYTEGPDGSLVPPGYRMIKLPDAPGEAEPGEAEWDEGAWGEWEPGEP